MRICSCGSRIGHEILVVGRRGNVPRFRDRGLDSRLVTRRGKHSEKPLEIYDIIMRACAGPYLEIFSRRRSVPGWHTIGDQLE